jgi:hypothetical protein
MKSVVYRYGNPKKKVKLIVKEFYYRWSLKFYESSLLEKAFHAKIYTQQTKKRRKMKKFILSLVTAFLFIIGFSIQLNATTEHDSQGDGTHVKTQSFFENFLKEGAPQEAWCDDCREDCPKYINLCLTDCLAANGICKTCKGSNCPSQCFHCSKCKDCLKDGWCCKSFLDGGGGCDPKPSTCSKDLDTLGKDTSNPS